MTTIQTIYNLDTKEEARHFTDFLEKDIEELAVANIDLIDDYLFIIGRQVKTNIGRIDLLCLHITGRLVIIELKKGRIPREIAAQIFEYNEWVKELDSIELDKIYSKYSASNVPLNIAFKDSFKVDLDASKIKQLPPRIIIAGTAIDETLESHIYSLKKNHNFDISIAIFEAFELADQKIISRTKTKNAKDDEELLKILSERWKDEYYFTLGDEVNRKWIDAKKYGFVSAGGGKKYSGPIRKLKNGNQIWVYVPGKGYVGLGMVLQEATPAEKIQIVNPDTGESTKFYNLELNANYHKGNIGDEAEYVVLVQWLHAVELEDAIKDGDLFSNTNTMAKPKSESWFKTLLKLSRIWKIRI